MDRKLMLHFWHSLTDGLFSSTQGTFMHVSWIMIAIMTVLMTGIAIVRMMPSRKAHRLRRIVAEQQFIQAEYPEREPSQ